MCLFATQGDTAALVIRGTFQTLSQGPHMTANSFQSCQLNSRLAFHGCYPGERSPVSNVSEQPAHDALCAALSNAHAQEAQRMKALSGQRKFRAPVAEDFARGMLAPGHEEGVSSMQSSRGWVGLIKALMTRRRGQKNE